MCQKVGLRPKPAKSVLDKQKPNENSACMEKEIRDNPN